MDMVRSPEDKEATAPKEENGCRAASLGDYHSVPAPVQPWGQCWESWTGTALLTRGPHPAPWGMQGTCFPVHSGWPRGSLRTSWAQSEEGP